MTIQSRFYFNYYPSYENKIEMKNLCSKIASSLGTNCVTTIHNSRLPWCKSGCQQLNPILQGEQGTGGAWQWIWMSCPDCNELVWRLVRGLLGDGRGINLSNIVLIHHFFGTIVVTHILEIISRILPWEMYITMPCKILSYL